EEKLGADAAQYFLSTPTTNKCCGECDRTYEIQEHYEQGIGNVVEDLKVILFSKRKNKKNIDEILVALESLL
ncbi:MAG: hypothetical protein RSA41_06310, partial [Christensenella sp.]